MPSNKLVLKVKVQSACEPIVAHQAGAYPGFCSMKHLGVFLPPPPPLDGMLVHHRVTPSIKFTSTYLYTWVERGTVRVCKVSCPRTQHWTTRSGVQRTNYMATMPRTSWFCAMHHNLGKVCLQVHVCS